MPVNKNRDDFVAALIAETPEILIRLMDELIRQRKVCDFPPMPQFHFHANPRYPGAVPDPRGGVRWIIPGKANYW